MFEQRKAMIKEHNRHGENVGTQDMEITIKGMERDYAKRNPRSSFFVYKIFDVTIDITTRA